MIILFAFTVWILTGACCIRRSQEISGWLAMIGDPRHGACPGVFWAAYVTCLLSGPFQIISRYTAPAVAMVFHKVFGQNKSGS